MLREHEKFWAFMALGLGVLLLVVLALWLGSSAKEPVIRIIDAAVGGFLLAFGSATNALFRIGSPGDERIKEVAAEQMQASLPPRPVTIEQPADEPVPVTDTPPMFREGV